MKGYWIKLPEEDFRIIGIKMKEKEICSVTKSEYKEKFILMALLGYAAIGYFQETKSKHRNIDQISYPSFQITPYLTSSQFNNKEHELLNFPIANQLDSN